jgi:sugar phosphate isomerase/epimerase
MLDDSGLKAYSSHVSLAMLDDANWQQTVDDHRVLGCDRLIVSSLPDAYRSDADAWFKTSQLFTQLDERLRSASMRTGFHAHWMEFTLLPDGTRGWDVIGRGTPDTFIMQYDTANGMQGGADPVQPIRDFPYRNELLHLKEYVNVADNQDPFEGHGQAAIGDGHVPWKDVFDAAESIGGTKIYIVEQEGHPTLAPMDAAELCVKNLLELLAARQASV